MDSTDFVTYGTTVMGGVMFLMRWLFAKYTAMPDAYIKGILIAFGVVVSAPAAHYLSPTTSAQIVVLMVGTAYGGQSALTTTTDTAKLTTIKKDTGMTPVKD